MTANHDTHNENAEPVKVPSEDMPPLDDRAAYSAEHVRQLIRRDRSRCGQPAPQDGEYEACPMQYVEKTEPRDDDWAVAAKDGMMVHGGLQREDALLIAAALNAYGQPAQPAASVEPVVVYMYQDKQDYVVHGTVPKGTSLRPGINTLYAAPVPAQPSVPDGWPKWYCVDKNGNADLCRSESEAYDYARLRSDAFPDRAPFQAMPLTPAPPAADQSSLPEGWAWVAPGLAKPPPGFIADAQTADGQAQEENQS